ncbi:MAG: hypothetical protein PHW32_04825 [Bacilli bacterium]|nr:hypothetical protein [Bacilli bacterium]MDD4283045.1 hypothetical protein [Bacilli bacterium]MDD4718563.1 hypothetical protein [Bacilli bacterium]
MRLFDSEKDWILKVTNLVLLVWLIAAITFFQIAIVDIAIPDYAMSYSEYESVYCAPFDQEDYKEENCMEQYDREKIYQNEHSIRQRKSVFTSFGNIIIVSLGIYLLNKGKK